ncbi:titin-like [Rhinichthys klamathensis goyatoka]|uniref:titin-like n=1 Tax=Rhinichthys klamathensis goyatoka TaxID=3034132 RepID=UPI0024B4AC39|nr:titin-like [Rhinichthys klamathensis goyatoka]
MTHPRTLLLQLPQPKLSIESDWETFYPNEKVILKCSINSNEWGYEWFKDGTQLSGNKEISFSGNTLTISSAKASHSGQYTCRGKHRERTPVTTRQAEALQLHIQDNTPKPDIRKDQWFDFFYTGEKVQLGCNMPGDGWEYDWYKGSKHLIRDPTFTINSASPSNTGDYHCTAKRGDFSVDSETLQVRVEEPPQPKLSTEFDWKTFYPSEKVILKCSINSNEWGYEWFRNRYPLPGNKEISFSGNTLSITSAKASHSGQYTCRGKHRERTLVTTRTTEALQLRVYDNTPKPDIRKDQQFDFFYTGEKVQLGCNMPGDGWEYDWYKGSKHLIRDPTFTINSASLSETGVYHCTAKRGDFSVNSETLQVRVEDPPKPKLSIESKWKTFYPNEKVILKCSINSNEWDYEWFRNRDQLSGDDDISFSGNTLSIRSAKASHSGQYTCRGKHLKRTPVTTRQAEALQLHIYDSTPKPDITKDQFDFFYTGEKVQLGCNMPGDGWEYDWYKGSKHLIRDPTFTIYSASLSETGVYHCTAKRGDFSVDSETLQVQVEDLPEAQVKSDWTEAFPGEKVTLQCVIPKSENWIYMWFIGSERIVPTDETSIKDNTLTLSVKSSHKGDWEYTCQAELKDRTVKTAKSESHSLRVHDGTPKPDIRKDQWFEPFYTGEKVQLVCNMSGERWTYAWYKGKKQTELPITGSTFTINSASPSNTSDYHCTAKRGDFSVDSETLQVRVEDLPEAQVKSDWTEAFPGEKVTLQCVIPKSENWIYMWFIGSERIVPTDVTSIKDNTLTLSVKSSHKGDWEYTCQAELKDRTVKTAKSESHSLTVHDDTPKPDIRKDQWFEPFYTGEKVQLVCNMSGERWTYAWYKGKKQTELPITGSTFTINSASPSNTSDYHCTAKRGDFSVDSETLQVRVEDLPEAQVKSDWTEAFPGEKVSLQCVIPKSENWIYMWFIGSERIVPTDVTSIKDNTLTLSVKSSHKGDWEYTCQAELKDRTVKTAKSESHSLTVHDGTPKPDIRKDQWFEPFYTGEKVQLVCNMSGERWTYAWYKGKKQTEPPITGSTFTINSASPSNTGDYHCTAKRGDFSVDSETLQVRVEDLPEAQVNSDWTEAFPGEKVSLQCVIPKSENWIYMWFKGSEEIVPTDETSIKDNTLTLSVKSSHKGDWEYTCQAELKDRTVKTAKSESHSLTVHEPPQPKLSIVSQWKKFYPNEKVTLKCSIDGDSKEWGHEWFKDGPRVSGNKDISFSGNTLTISSAKASHSGQYTCRGKHLKRTPVTTRQAEALQLHIHGK